MAEQHGTDRRRAGARAPDQLKLFTSRRGTTSRTPLLLLALSTKLHEKSACFFDENSNDPLQLQATNMKCVWVMCRDVVFLHRHSQKEELACTLVFLEVLLYVYSRHKRFVAFNQ